MKKLTNAFNRQLESRFQRKVAQRQQPNADHEKRLDLEDIKRRVATYKQRWGEDPEL
jgi:hypothetical protein